MSQFIPNEKGEGRWFLGNALDELRCAKVHLRNLPELEEKLKKVIYELEGIWSDTPKKAP